LGWKIRMKIRMNTCRNIRMTTCLIETRPMKSRTPLFYFAILPALLAPAVGVRAQEPSPVTGTFVMPVAPGSTPVTSTQALSTPVTNAPVMNDDASAGLADERLRAAANAPVLSITDVIALALQQNPQRAAAWAAVEAARERIGTAKAAGGPQVNLGGSATTERAFGFPSASGVGGGAGGIGGGTGSSSTTTGRGWNNSQSLSVDATIPVYSGGRVKSSKRVAQYSAEAQYAQARALEQDLVYNTAITYLNVLRGEQLLDVSEANLAVARERSRIAGVRYEAGAAARLEVLRAETDLANARQNRISSSNALGQSLSALNTLMGRTPETPLRVEPIINLTLPAPLFTTTAANPVGSPAQTSTPSAQGAAPNSTTGNTANNAAGNNTGTVGLPDTGSTGIGGSTPVAGATAPSGGAAVGTAGVSTAGIGTITAAPSAQLQLAAGQGRQSLAATQAQIRAAEASVDVVRAAKKPSIGLDILGLIRNPVSFAGRFLLSIGANLAQNLFDSGRTSSQIREAQAVVRQLRAQYKGDEQAVANDIEQSLLLLDSAQKRLTSADAGVVAAREALRAAQLGYSAGASTALEVSDAQTALLVAETDAVNARFDVAASQAQLSAAVGVYPGEATEAYRRVLQNEKNNPDLPKDLKNAQYPGIKR
jgi:outer membrane protein TolC